MSVTIYYILVIISRAFFQKRRYYVNLCKLHEINDEKRISTEHRLNLDMPLRKPRKIWLADYVNAALNQ